MGYGENRGDYWRGRYKIAPGKYGTVKDEYGKTRKFTTQRAAEKAAAVEEARVVAEARAAQAEAELPPEPERLTFGQYAERWYGEQDLAVSTMQNYKHHLEDHLLPTFQDIPLHEITKADVLAWERQEKALYEPSSVKTWRSTLHLAFSDAVDEGLRESNPAWRRRGRGKRAGRSRNRAPEKVVTNALGFLLIAERTSLLSGRDDEFIAMTTKGYQGIRWGELVGLEKQYVRPATVRIEQQIYELDSGELVRCPPKDDSYRTTDAPSFIASLLARQIARTDPKPCVCHGRTYVFSGYGAANGSVSRPGAKLADVARRAGVSTGTVSNVLNRPNTVTAVTRARVAQAIADLGYVRNAASGEQAAHWRRNGFAQWLFQPAVTGWYPKKAPQEAHPVPILADPWPGIPARGRGAAARADAAWLPIAKGMTPHSARHFQKVLLDTLKTPKVPKDERMGHLDGSVQAGYSHVTDEMREELVDGLTGIWEAALEARRRMCPTSPVAVLNDLLAGAQQRSAE
ncbi:LacI family DNA-binding transcriptional regulator [Kitasatospora kifunensis]|uniref:LacI family transcriptional regulator n=1 Tax=Kitasatospora kifunensis TaxID=58351 RepID=A0A7W7VWB7_KITKI|nr:LacI family DNA-binding transcriptional regulator [Kitasatospora kifunensis]MBB4924793.1 hypothetical protein [Kitasatospora kifunensis]